MGEGRILRIRFKWLLVIVAPFLFGGVCEMVPTSEPIEPNHVLGVFVADFEPGLLDMIELRPGSTYIHTYVSWEGGMSVDTATYSLSYPREDKRYPSLALNEFISRYPVYGISGNVKDETPVLDTTAKPLFLVPYLPHTDTDKIKLVRSGSLVGGDAYIRPRR